MKYLMALDAGSGSCRSVIFNDDGEEVGFGSREWWHPLIPQYPGSQIFETERNWQRICESIKESMARAKISPGNIAAVSVTSMRFGSVLYDGSGKEVWAAPNTDARASKEKAEVMKKGLFEFLYQITGDGVALCDLMRWMWVREHLPEIWNKVSHFTLISDWVLYKLCGKFVTDPSLATCSGLFDISRRAWSQEIAELFSIPLNICPEIVESGTMIGEVTSRAARETGLKEKTPIVVGGGDTMSGLVGTGCVEKGVSVVIGGTHWQQTYLSDKPQLDPKKRIRISSHMIPNLWMMETNAVFIGLTMRWFRDAFCDMEKVVAKELGVDTYFIMEKMAEKAPPGSNGLIGIFANLFNVANWVHAAPAFIQFDVNSPERSGKKEFIRRIEEDAAFQSYGNLINIWEAANFKANEDSKIIFAGGASKGYLWPQILADVLGYAVKVPVVKEATAFGAAICAGVGVGIYNSISEAAKTLVKWDKVYEPNMKNHEIYRKLYIQWREVYQHSLIMVEKKLTAPFFEVADQ